jgi:hypothetical protein
MRHHYVQAVVNISANAAGVTAYAVVVLVVVPVEEVAAAAAGVEVEAVPLYGTPEPVNVTLDLGYWKMVTVAGVVTLFEIPADEPEEAAAAVVEVEAEVEVEVAAVVLADAEKLDGVVGHSDEMVADASI